MLKPLLNSADNEWIEMVGRYILNMGAIEGTTRLLVAQLLGNEDDPIFCDVLASRIAFLRKRFPRNELEQHKRAMNVFEVADRHCGFRNIVAHSPLLTSKSADGSTHIEGLLNLAPKNKTIRSEVVSLAELRARVDESAEVAQQLLEMQHVFQAN